MVSVTSSSVTASSTVRELVRDGRVQRAGEFFEAHAEAITQEQIRICETPAPPFGEQQRAAYFINRFRAIGLEAIEIDAEGNATALRRGRELAPLIVVSAHLDTVFPENTNCKVKREANILRAPGVADDGCGLAALIALGEALNHTGIETRGSLLFVATVGEEGEGDLRGARHLLTKGRWANQVDAFLSLDGPGIERITNAALGSRRYQITFKGQGGHSWGDFGAANPVHAAGRLIANLTKYDLRRESRASFNVGRIEGGTSVNAIPQSAVLQVDLRADAAAELRRLDGFFHRALADAVQAENHARRAGKTPLMMSAKLTGNRPSGTTPRNSFIVELAQQATRLMGARPHLDCSSTDSNIAISLNIPALTIGAGGTAGGSHTLEEWYDTSNRHIGLQRDLLVVLGLVGLVNQ